MIPKFNPWFQGDREAIANFVVRQFQFEQIIDALLISATTDHMAPQFLVSAPRGAGKTTLCRRVVAEVRVRSELASAWQPVFLGEESYTVTSPGEFLLEVLFHLNDQEPSAHLQDDWEYAKGATEEPALIKRCLAALRSFVESYDRRLLIVVENFHIILADQLQGRPAPGEALLEILDDKTLFSILATSVVNASNEDEVALPEDYARIELTPLTLNECKALWLALTRDDVPAEKIRPIQILTGGSPRLIHILADFMKTRSLRDLMDNLNFLIDQNTEYFKSQLDALPAVERKVFAALLEIWDPTTAKQVAETARVNTNIASAMLGRLTDRGAVIKEQGQGRNSIYFAAERLFNIYYLMRRRSHPSSRVKALVTFMVEFYSSEELVSTTESLAREACALDPSRRSDHHSTFHAILAKTTGTVRDEILKAVPTEFIRSFREERRESRRTASLTKPTHSLNSDGRLSELIDRIEKAADDGDIVAARDMIKEALELDDSVTELWIRLAFAENELGNTQGAVAAATRATEMGPTEPWTHTVLGLSLRASGREDDAMSSYRQALTLDAGHVPALVEASAIAEKRDDISLALKFYEDAENANSLEDITRALYAQLLSRTKQLAKAEQILRASASEFDNRLTRRALVQFLHAHDRPEEAEDWLENFAEHEARWEAFADLGRYLLTEAENGPAARDALRTAIAMGADKPIVFSRLAHALIASKAPADEVSAIVLQMLGKFADQETVWVLAGHIYEELKDDAEAEAAYRSAMEREDGKAGRMSLARFLDARSGRQEEAEALLLQAVAAEAGRKQCAPLRELAEHYVHLGDDREADTVLQKAATANDRCVCCHVMRGDLCRRNNQLTEAENEYRAALRIANDDVGALTGLAHVVGKSEAAQLIAKALRSDSDDPRAVLASLQWSELEASDRLKNTRKLSEDYPNYFEASLFASTLEAEVGDLESAISRLEAVLEELPSQREIIPIFVKSAMAVVESGGAKQLRDILQPHRNRDTVEPLMVAIRLTQGETPLVAKEILEVARDIVSQSS